jgi:hypothetical protein
MGACGEELLCLLDSAEIGRLLRRVVVLFEGFEG